MKSTTAERLKMIMDERDLRQIDIIRMCQPYCSKFNVRLERNDLSQYVNGKVSPSQYKLTILGLALNVSETWLMGYDVPMERDAYAPEIAEDYVTYPVLGEVACGYEHVAVEDWEGEKIEIPRSFLHGGKYEDYFVLKITGTSMLPDFRPNDRVLVKKQTTCDYSGQNAVIIYDNDYASLKQLIYNMGEDWLEMRPTNTSQYATVRIEGADLEKCKVLGIPKVLVRDL